MPDLNAVDSRSRLLQTLVAITVIAAIAWVDDVIGPQIPVGILYVWPILRIVRLHGVRVGGFVAAAAVALSFIPDVVGQTGDAGSWIIVANAVARLAIYLVLITAYGRMLASRDQLEDTVRARTATLANEILQRRKSEGELLDAQRIAQVGSWTLDLATGRTTWSPEIYRLAGWDVGATPPAFAAHRDLFTAGSWQDLGDAVARIVATGDPEDGEFETIRADGSRGWIRAQGESVRDASGALVSVRGTVMDITERKLADAASRNSEALHRVILGAARDGFWLLDLQGRLLEVNDAYCRMSGYGQQELLTKGIVDLEATESAADTAARVQAVIAEGGHRFETRHRRKDGTVFDVAVSAQYLPADGGRLLAFIQDITMRKQAEIALRSSLKQKDALLREVHHRVKNNLQVVASLLRLEARRAMHDDAIAALNDMQGRVHSMALLYEKLYRSASFDGVDLGGYLRQLTTDAFVTLAATPSSVRLEFDLCAATVGTDCAVPCGLIVNELVTNAVEHGFPDGRHGEIHVSLRPIDGDRRLRLCVRDTGVGLPPDFAARRERSLGLTLVSDLARQLGGTLEIGPQPAAAFAITFPVDAGDPALAMPAALVGSPA